MKCKTFIPSLWFPSLLVFMLTLVACIEIFEPSIERSRIKPLAPEDGYVSNDPTVSFWFEPLEYALYYRLQVVKPDFDSIGGLVLDTLIDRNTFSYDLNPGSYEWRVRAENGSSTTRFSSEYSIIITASSAFIANFNDKRFKAVTKLKSENLF